MRTLVIPHPDSPEMEEIREVTFGARVRSVMLRAVNERHRRWAVH